MGDFFGVLAAGPFFFVSSWVLMLFVGGFAGDVGSSQSATSRRWS